MGEAGDIVWIDMPCPERTGHMHLPEVMDIIPDILFVDIIYLVHQ